MYETRCPQCGEEALEVTSFKATCNIPLTADGFSVADATTLSTEDLHVACLNCEWEGAATLYDDLDD